MAKPKGSAGKGKPSKAPSVKGNKGQAGKNAVAKKGPGANKPKYAKKEKAEQRFPKAFIPVPVEENSDSGSEIDMDDSEDYDIEFLARMDSKAITKPVSKEKIQAEAIKQRLREPKIEENAQKRKRKVEDSEGEEMEQEKKPRTAPKEVESNRLPIKMGARIYKNERLDQSESEDSQDEGEEDGEEAESEDGFEDGEGESDLEMEGEEGEDGDYMQPPGAPEPAEMTMAQKALAARQALQQAKEEIARISMLVLEDAEANITQLKSLHEYASDPARDIVARRLAIVSLLSVFKDILPGYRIRLPTSEEKGAKLSKEVKKLRQFEAGMLGAYQRYLQLCNKFLEAYQRRIKAKSEGKVVTYMAEVEGLASLGVRCLCDMLLARPDFNYTNNIITALLPAALTPLPQALEKICQTLRELYARDKRMATILEVVKALANLAKQKNYSIPQPLIETFTSLRFSEDLLDTSINPINNKRSGPPAHVSRKNKKKDKKEKELETELEMASAEQNKAELKRTQTEILKLVFLTYFRVLKSSASSPLLPAVLKGLAKHAHLINVDFFADLLSTLSSLLASGHLSFESSLHCVQTAFAIVSGQGAVLIIDTKDLFTHLYGLLAQAPSHQSLLPALLECVGSMQTQQHMLTAGRVASFVKRLLAVALQIPGGAAVGVVAMANQLMQKQPRVQGLLDSEGLGAGVYLSEAEDPETANAMAAGLWELHALKTHSHPAVALLVAEMLKRPQGDSGHIPLLPPGLRKPPLRLLQEYDNSQGGFNPPITAPRQHPRAKNMAKSLEGGEPVFICLRSDAPETTPLPIPSVEPTAAAFMKLLPKSASSAEPAQRKKKSTS